MIDAFGPGVDGAIVGIGVAFGLLMLMEMFFWRWADPANSAFCMKWLFVCLIMIIGVFVVFVGAG